MKNSMYVIFDKKAEECGPVYVCKNDNVASRLYINTLKGEIKNGLDVSDYDLYCIGTIDTETMVIEPGRQLVAVDFNEGGEI